MLTLLLLACGASAPELTAAANDFGFSSAFARAVEARAGPADLLVVHSTSGTSENVVRAVEAAGRIGARTVALTGEDGGVLEEAADLCLAVPAADPARIQELHLAVEHAVVDRVDGWVAGGDDGTGGSRGETVEHIENRRGEEAIDGGSGS